MHMESNISTFVVISYSVVQNHDIGHFCIFRKFESNKFYVCIVFAHNVKKAHLIGVRFCMLIYYLLKKFLNLSLMLSYIVSTVSSRSGSIILLSPGWVRFGWV